MIANTPSTPRPKQVDIEKDFHKDTPGFMRWVQKKVEESAKLHQLTEYEKPGDTYITNEYLIVLDMGVEHKTISGLQKGPEKRCRAKIVEKLFDTF